MAPFCSSRRQLWNLLGLFRANFCPHPGPSPDAGAGSRKSGGYSPLSDPAQVRLRPVLSVLWRINYAPRRSGGSGPGHAGRGAPGRPRPCRAARKCWKSTPRSWSCNTAQPLNDRWRGWECRCLSPPLICPRVWTRGKVLGVGGGGCCRLPPVHPGKGPAPEPADISNLGR